MTGTHAKRHDINDEKNHIKNDLDINGNFSVLPGNKLILGKGASYEQWSQMYWDDTEHRFFFNHSIESSGSLLLGGEATIFGGPLANDSITIKPSRIAGSTPYINMEGTVSMNLILNDGSSEHIAVINNAYSPTTFFKVDKDGMDINVPITSGLTVNGLLSTNSLAVEPNEYLYFDYPTISRWIRWNTTSSYFEFDGDIYTNGKYIGDGSGLTNVTADSLMISPNEWLYFDYSTNSIGLRYDSSQSWLESNHLFHTPAEDIGDTSGNHVYITKDGINLYGSARKYGSMFKSGYDISGNSATYNGVSCNASSAAIVSDKWTVRTFTDGSGWGGSAEAAIVNFVIPTTYEAGENLKVVIDFMSNSTSGDVAYGVGLLTVGTDGQYDGTETYQTGTVSIPTTALKSKKLILDFNGSGINPGDKVTIIIYRNGPDSSDTVSGDVYVVFVGMKYPKNKLGEDI